MFFSTCTPIEETLRNDLITLTRQLERYFDDASKWDERRQEMMGLARDLARRDMHDGILQSLAALKMRLVTIISTPASISNPELDALRKTIDMITVEQTRLRSLLHDDEAGDGIGKSRRNDRGMPKNLEPPVGYLDQIGVARTGLFRLIANLPKT